MSYFVQPRTIRQRGHFSDDARHRFYDNNLPTSQKYGGGLGDSVTQRCSVLWFQIRNSALVITSYRIERMPNKSCHGLMGQATEENGGGHKCNHGGSLTGI